MILPGTTTFKGVIGTTFDAVVAVYFFKELPPFANPLSWNKKSTYKVGEVVVGENGNAYEAVLENTNQVVTNTKYWALVKPVNIENLTAEMVIGPTTLKEAEGLTNGKTGGTVSIELTPEQTKSKSVGSEKFSLTLTEKEGVKRKYEYLKGNVQWEAE